MMDVYHPSLPKVQKAAWFGKKIPKGHERKVCPDSELIICPDCSYSENDDLRGWRGRNISGTNMAG
jgi:hypothetical protein